jgi:ATP-dependent RNA helicase DDX51/DBP6
LTRDPAAIASLNLNDPKYTIITSTNPLTHDPEENPSNEVTDPSLLGTQFTLPQTLSEKYLVVPPQHKPLHLIHLLHCPEYSMSGGILVFTKSVESVGRLVRLLEEFEKVYSAGTGAKPTVVRGYSGDMKGMERKNLLADFSSGKINM